MFTGKEMDSVDRAFAVVGFLGVVGELVQSERRLSAAGRVADAIEEDARTQLKGISMSTIDTSASAIVSGPAAAATSAANAMAASLDSEGEARYGRI